MKIPEMLAKIIQKTFFSPRHIRVSAGGESLDDCLRELEKAARLPRNDLSFDSGNPMRVSTFPVRAGGIRHNIVSKISDSWRAKNKGYVSGSVFDI